MDESVGTTTNETLPWQPQRRNGRIEINANVYGPDGGRKSLTALTPLEYLRVWYEGRLDFQREGRERPAHLPEPQEVSDFLEQEKQRPVPPPPPVVKITSAEQTQRQYWKARPSPRELRKQDAEESPEMKTQVARDKPPSIEPSPQFRARFITSVQKNEQKKQSPGLPPEVRAKLCPSVLRQYESNIFTVKEATKLSRYGHDLQIKYATQLIRGLISIEDLR